MRIFKIAFAIILSVVDLLQIATAFLLTDKNYGYYSGQLDGAWRLFIFPTTLLLCFVIGAIAVARKKDWGFAVLLLPLFLPFFAQVTGLNMNFVDTSAIDKKNEQKIQEFLRNADEQLQ